MINPRFRSELDAAIGIVIAPMRDSTSQLDLETANLDDVSTAHLFNSRC